MQQPTKEYAQKVFQSLKKHYPHAKMILQWTNNFELLVSIILSAQCTDKKVNEVTSQVFPKYKQARPQFADQYPNYLRMVMENDQTRIPEEEVIEMVNFTLVPVAELEQDIKSTGFYHNKAKNVQAAAKTTLIKFHGVLPKTIAELTTIPGVGRKTANVFLGNAYSIYEGIAVDTHVTKQSQLLGLTKNKTPEKIEQDLMQLFPKNEWFPLTYLLIEHGRNMRRKMADRISCTDLSCLLGDNT